MMGMWIAFSRGGEVHKSCIKYARGVNGEDRARIRYMMVRSGGFAGGEAEPLSGFLCESGTTYGATSGVRVFSVGIVKTEAFDLH